MRERCAWTNERSDRLIAVELPGVNRLGRPAQPVTLHVLPEHAAELRIHAERVRRYGTPFLVAIVTLSILILAAALLPVFGDAWRRPAIVGTGIVLGLMGALVIALPFSTPETSRFFGLRRSIQIARASGALLVLMAAAIVLFG